MLLAVSDMGDPVVDDARGRKADFDAQLVAVRAARPGVAARRREAAELLEQSREAERQNHFAEAITASMRRRE